MKRKLQIFVSSTYSDLLFERQAAVAAILKAAHIPAGMELFTAADRSQMVTIKQWIDESDVYMLILGGRYGSIEPTSGISYTELEYDYAVEQKKPLFAVVTTEAALEAKIRANGTTFGEKHNPKQLSLFRSKVLGNISSFFEDPKDIRLCVHESLADMALNRELKGWVSADEVVDTKPLFDEIRKLADENRQLKEALAEQDKRLSKKVDVKDSFKELRKVLAAIDVKVPAKVVGMNEDLDIDLLRIFFNGKESFVNGITNAHGIDAYDTFMFYNVCPKLQVHGLTINERVAGVRYRRYAITQLGSAFLADMERTLVLAKSNTPAAPAAAKAKVAPDKSSTQVPAKKATGRRPVSPRSET
jgi:Domain of unknown function (DUF4062)